MFVNDAFGFPLARRDLLLRSANGFGTVALAALANDWSGNSVRADEGTPPARDSSPAPGANRLPEPHFTPRAKNVIFLYMDGGPSQVDTFDPKPRLAKDHGQPIPLKVPVTAERDVGKVMKSPWKFQQHGDSGIAVSELFPHLAGCVDELCVIRSMVSKFSEHSAANLFLHSGGGQLGRPSLGSWFNYGLGSECQDLPGFVVLSSGMIPPAGEGCFHHGQLPAQYQASLFKSGRQTVADLAPAGMAAEPHDRKWDLLRSINRRTVERYGQFDELEAAISNYELAFRMQTAVPELVDISGESDVTQKLYGMDSDYEPTRTYGRQCLTARRLLERGVRFIELLCPAVDADRWDQHEHLLEGHGRNAKAIDQPIAGLLTDLKARGMLKDTLVVWAGEFGRTPMAQGTHGRDHNPFGFSIWLAGAGIRAGTVYGATDEFGYYAVDNPVEIHELHATMLHLLGIDHEKLTIRHSGRDLRLTDVYGSVVHEVISA